MCNSDAFFCVCLMMRVCIFMCVRLCDSAQGKILG